MQEETEDGARSSRYRHPLRGKHKHSDANASGQMKGVFKGRASVVVDPHALHDVGARCADAAVLAQERHEPATSGHKPLRPHQP